MSTLKYEASQSYALLPSDYAGGSTCQSLAQI